MNNRFLTLLTLALMLVALDGVFNGLRSALTTAAMLVVGFGAGRLLSVLLHRE